MTLDSGSVAVVEEIIRDGSYASEFKFKPDELRVLASELDELTFVDYIDVGPGTGFGTEKPVPEPSDRDHLDIVTDVISDTELTTLFLPDIAGKKEIELVKSYSESMGMIRIGVDADNVSAAVDLLNVCTDLDITTSLNLLKTYLISPEAAAEAARFAASHGADVVYVVDSAGGFQPQDVSEYVSQIRDKVDIEVGYHGHNNLGMALQNTISAVDAGAKYIDGSLQGIGRSAGNLQTELLCANFQSSITVEDWRRMMSVENMLTDVYPGESGVAIEDVLYGLAQFHSSFEADLREFAIENDEEFLDLLIFAAQRQLASVSDIRREYRSEPQDQL